jgi:hypothetical protein
MDASHQHQPIEQTTKYQDATEKWITVNQSTFAGWYTRPFCEDVIDSFSQEFAIQDAADANVKWTDTEQRRATRDKRVTPGKCSF